MRFTMLIHYFSLLSRILRYNYSTMYLSLLLVKFVPSVQFSSVQFSRSVVSNSLQPHGLQHAMLPCPSPTPGAYSNSCPSSQWCHPTVSSSVIPILRLPSIFSSIRVFSNESVLYIMWSKNFEAFYSHNQFSSVVSNSLWPPCTAARQASLSITNSRSLLRLMSIESVMPSNHLILCCPLLLLPSIFPSL